MKGTNRKLSNKLLITVLLFILSGCTPLWGKTIDVNAGLRWAETPTPFLPLEYQPSIQVSSSTPTSVPFITTQVPETGESGKIWISEAVPPLLQAYIKDTGMLITNDMSAANYRFDNQAAQNDSNTTWVYAFVAPFSTIKRQFRVVGFGKFLARRR